MPTPIDKLSDALRNTPVLDEHQGDQNPVASRQSQHGAAARRNRSQLSCTQCRHAKSRCDRQQPCSQCVKRGKSSQCTFPAPAIRKKPAVSMQNRLSHLESLVKKAMTAQSLGAQRTPPQEELVNRTASEYYALNTPAFNISVPPRVRTPADVGHPTDYRTEKSHDGSWNSSGSVVQSSNETTYIGATHWAAILDDIEEVKGYFNTEDSDDEPDDIGIQPETSIIFHSSTATKEDIIAALPAKNVVNQLMLRYFVSNSPAINITHKPTFQNEYAKFWADPASTPLAWIALLYAMMSLASFAALGAGEENPDPRGNHMELIRMYRHSCSQALVLSNYTRPGQYTIEAMLLYMQVEFVLTSIDPVNSYVFIGAVVRIALRMGLHRDASKIGSDLSVFQAEMRRRHWHILQQLDLIISFHIGLPPMIQSVESDTEYPRNLRDEDLNKDLAELPAARPEAERTPMSYIVGKSRICAVFGKIAALAHRISLPLYDEVLHVDKLLEEAHSKIPPFLKFVPVELAIIDPPELVIQRFNIALLYQKCRCVLHRKYLLIEKYSEEFAYSRLSGYDASMRLLRLQTEMYRLCQPGGLLCKDKWIVSALTTRDSLLAATMVYLNLMQLIDTSPLDAATDTEQKRIDMIQVLESSFFTWKRLQGLLPDARKASDILGLMLQKIKGALASQKSSKEDTSQQAATRFSDGSGNEWVEYNVQNNMSHTVIPITNSGSQDVPSMVAPMVPMESLDTMFDMPMNFDWDIFDDHLRPQPMATAQLQEWPDISIEDFHQFENSGMMYNL